MSSDLVFIALGALAGGFANGLTGFGLALAALPFWLTVQPPPMTTQLAAASAIVSGGRTLPEIWPHIRARAVLPYIVPGFAGVPLGLWLAPLMPAAQFRLVVGVLMIIYSSVQLLAGPRLKLASAPGWINPVVGFGGGVLGGLAGLSGVLPGLWATVIVMPKEAKRALFQTLNVSILIGTMLLGGMSGRWTVELGHLLLWIVPLTLIGNGCGMWLYRRVDGIAFDRLVLALLLIGGISLVAR